MFDNGLPQLACFLLFVPLVLGGLAFWVWMLVDCLQKEPAGSNEKLTWVLVILFGHFLGAVIYYFVRRAERLRLGTAGVPGPAAPPE
ncbi:MAG TPA: PLD nuclease N-terminal domain-containing protein [Thermoanaerobaculia bacterium]|nr:PLD nuclease N-terminal domain-containing protein [Thermoanaerobaculia bacterium]